MLTKRQMIFVEEYLKTSNASRSALTAGYAPYMASKRAHTLLRNPEIKKYIDQAREILEEEMQITLREVLAEYARIAFADIRRLYDKNGNLIPAHQLDADTAAAVSSVHTRTFKDGNTSTHLRMRDKCTALDHICKLLGFGPEKSENSPLIVNWMDNTGEITGTTHSPRIW